MVTLQTIKSELSDIRYYYARREMFEKAFDCVGKNAILEKVEKYNKAVLNAPPKLYEGLCRSLCNGTYAGSGCRGVELLH